MVKARSGVLCAAAFVVGITRMSCDYTFASMGDWGQTGSTILRTGEALKNRINTDKISMIVSPGSNFKEGVTGTDDKKWQTIYNKAFYDAEAKTNIPLLTVLGGEDWSANYTALIEAGKVARTKTPIFTLPNWWYHRSVTFHTGQGVLGGHVSTTALFVFIDTWVLSGFPLRQITERHTRELRATLEVAPKLYDYIIVVGDRPLSSSHSFRNRALSRILHPLFEKAQVDAYIAGGDAHLEVLQDSAGFLQIISGSAAGGSYARSPVAASRAYSAQPGFLVHTLTGAELVTKAYDADNQLLFTHKAPRKDRKQGYNVLPFVSKLPPVVYVPVPYMGRVAGGSPGGFLTFLAFCGLCIGAVFAFLATATILNRTK